MTDVKIYTGARAGGKSHWSAQAVNRTKMVAHCCRVFKLNIDGYHGIRHWERVERVGLELAHKYDVNPAIITTFAMFHDCRRIDENKDQEHGQRSALEWVRYEQDHGHFLSVHEARLVYQAIQGHSDGLITAPIEVQVCWDADRLDLSRVGITVDPKMLCTDHSRRYLVKRNDGMYANALRAPQYGIRSFT